MPAAVLDAGRLRVLPQRHGTDGAFAARLRRPNRDGMTLARDVPPSLVYLVAIIGGFSLAYLLVAFVIFPPASSRAT